MLLHVIDIEYLGEYKLKLFFSDGAAKIVDLENELDGTVFEPLKDKRFFKQCRINPTNTTVEWPNGADFAPEFLYEIGIDTDRKEVA